MTETERLRRRQAEWHGPAAEHRRGPRRSGRPNSFGQRSRRSAPSGAPLHRRRNAGRRAKGSVPLRHGETRCKRAGAFEREPTRMPSRRTAKKGANRSERESTLVALDYVSGFETLPPGQLSSRSQILPAKNYGLADGQAPDARDCAVNPRVVLVRANGRLQHFARRAPSIRIEVHHRAAHIAHRDGDRGSIVSFAEREHAAQPFILLERDRAGTERTTIFGRNRGTSALLFASRRTLRTVSDVRLRTRA